MKTFALQPYQRAGLIIFCCLLAAACQGVPADQQVDYEDIEELIEETDPAKKKFKVQGSCNMIARGSHCLDYVGSYWENEQFMRLNCEGTGTFSKNTCPYSDVGGCRATEGTIMETIMWAYNSGGSPITPDVAPFEQKACDLNPAASWVLPEF